MKGKRLLTLVAPLAVAGAILVPATDALANSGDYIGAGVNIRTGPHLNSTVVGLGYQGQGATVTCWVYGDYVNGNNLWVWNRDNATGKSGYSSSVYVTWSGGIPAC